MNNIASELYEILHQSWDYARGVELYELIGGNQVWKMTFSLGENSFTTEKLRQELTLLEPSYPFTVERRQKVEEKLPLEVVELEQQWKRLFKEANHLRTELFRRGSDGELLLPEEERGKLAHQVRDRFDEIERLWGAVDYFRKHGHIPPAFTKVETELTDREAMTKRLLNLRTYITKSRKGTKKYRLSPEQMEAEAADIERRLKS